MLRSILIGLISGMRSMTPLAAVSAAAASGTLPRDTGAPALLGHPLVVGGTSAMAAGELLGDKWASAPDRIIAPGIAARLVTGAVAGAALAPRRQWKIAALVGAAAAVASSYVTFDLRMRALRRYGQVSTGIVEDAIMLAGTALVMKGAAADAATTASRSPA